jgi:hypothetical protein
MMGYCSFTDVESQLNYAFDDVGSSQWTEMGRVVRMTHWLIRTRTSCSGACREGGVRFPSSYVFDELDRTHAERAGEMAP